MEVTFIQRLRTEVEREMIHLQAVATHEADIASVNDDYRARRKLLKTDLRRLGLKDPNPWPDLWLWYGFCKESSELATYLSRRELVIRRYQPLLNALDRLENRQLGSGLEIPETGWERVDNQTRQLRERFALAQTTEDFQDVGLRCREILISLGQAVYDPTEHVAEGEAPRKASDATHRLTQVARKELASEGSERLKKLVLSQVDAVWDAAVALQHDRAAGYLKAATVAEFTLAIVGFFMRLIEEPVGERFSAALRDEDFDQPELEDEMQDFEPDEEDLRYLSELARREEWAGEWSDA